MMDSAPRPAPAAKRPAILLSAFACDPKTGSEPYVGWNWATMLAEDYDVHVLTRRYSQPLILGHELARSVTFHYFDLPYCARFNHHWRLIKPYYCLWQILVLPLVLVLHRRYGFGIVHHVTYNNVDLPGLLWLCPSTRFVWGPVGGGQVAPPSLRQVFGRRWWKERLRGLLKASARYNPLVIAALSRARLVFFANQETAARVVVDPRRSRLMLETAIGDTQCALPELRRRDQAALRILWLSHVFARKALGLAIDAFAEASRRCPGGIQLELVVIGDGPALGEARQQAAASGLAERISMLGAVQHGTVQAHMRTADMFLFTSVQDTSGNVVLEAMANALPVIALDHQGARVIMAGRGGRQVPVGDYAATVVALADAILELATSEATRLALGAEARRHVLEHHTWKRKRHAVLDAYRSVAQQP